MLKTKIADKNCRDRFLCFHLSSCHQTRSSGQIISFSANNPAKRIFVQFWQLKITCVILLHSKRNFVESISKIHSFSQFVLKKSNVCIKLLDNSKAFVSVTAVRITSAKYVTQFLWSSCVECHVQWEPCIARPLLETIEMTDFLAHFNISTIHVK